MQKPAPIGRLLSIISSLAMKSKRQILTVLAIIATVMPAMAQNPPITPAWAFGHFVWEDNINTEQGAKDIVDGYLDRGVPVDAVFIDSPWTTSYNDFNWDTERYPDPKGMVRYFSDRNVKVILWMTGFINKESKDTPNQECSMYEEVRQKNFGVDDSTPITWWKGYGIHIDFTNPDAVAYWNSLLDKVFVEGVYGWKVDQGEHYLGKIVKTSKGEMAHSDFKHLYYDSMYDYTTSRKKDGIIIGRPYSHQGGRAASVSKLSLGWCGDFSGDWDGLHQQINNIYLSSQNGYAAVATEVGGFYIKPATKNSLVRYAQFGAMTACMINGGENGAFTAHVPWYHGEDAFEAYSTAVNLHESLRPYMFSTVVDCHFTGGTLVRDHSFEEESHKVGEYVFTKAVTNDEGSASFHLPVEGEWIDYWTGESFGPYTVISKIYPLDKFPLFIKAGAIIPIHRDGRTEILIYPNGKSAEVLHLPLGEGTEYEDCTVTYDAKSGLLSVKSDSAVDLDVTIVKGGTRKTKAIKGNNIKIKI